MIKDTYKTNEHPFKPYIQEGATKLIIGTMPPERFCVVEGLKGEIEDQDVRFYYGSKDNQFWSLIGEVFNEKFDYENTEEAVQQRKDFLEKNGMGITDMIAKCERKNGSASDDGLVDREYKDIAKLLENSPKIEVLIYTSEEVKSCVYNAIDSNAGHSMDKNQTKKGTIKINEKKYKVYILYSPSPQVRRAGITDDERISQFKEVFEII